MTRPSRTLSACGAAAMGALAATQAGCLGRQLTITSTPPGATVWLNDVQIGRTPVSAEFTHFGDFDVRLEHEGYEALATHRRARAPWYEWPPIDLAATVLPFNFQTSINWHFELTPRSSEADAGVVDRAKQMRDETQNTPDK